MLRFEIDAGRDEPSFYMLNAGADGAPRCAAVRGGLAAGVVEFWAEIDDRRPLERRAFRVYGTGHEIDGAARWRATCPRDAATGLVWHLYELLGM
jgi:hypothetical protein